MNPGFFPLLLTVMTSAIFCAAAMHSTMNSYGTYLDSNPNVRMHYSPNDNSIGDTRTSSLTGQDRYSYDRVPQDQHNRRTDPDIFLNLLDMRNPNEPLIPTRSLFPVELAKENPDVIHPEGSPEVEMFEDRDDDRQQTKALMESGMVKSKKESHSLSIVNPLDVLRQRLMLEMARRRMKENQDQIRANDVILKTLGKRSSSAPFAVYSKDSGDDVDDDDEKREGGGAAGRRRIQRTAYVNRQDSSVADFEV